MIKSLALTFSACFFSLISFSQISFDTSYHESLNLDSNIFSYDYSYYLKNNAADPSDTLFQWEITYVENTENYESWDWYVLTNFIEVDKPTGKYNCTILYDTSFLFRLGFWIMNRPGYNTARLKVTSVLHPEITDSVTLKLRARNLLSIEVPKMICSDIYPNPSSGLVKIKCIRGSEYRLMNSIGQNILEGNLENDLNDLDLSRLTTGIYTLVVYRDDKNSFISKKISILH
ncbi:MAG: T9SS type A sorting domain-containing protein [Bacteroidia bacterium]